MEIKLFGVTRGSLHELLNDYEDYMRTRNVAIWKADNPRYGRLLDFCRSHNATEEYTVLIGRMDDEAYCNLMLTLIHQTVSMIDTVKEDFIRNGGITEQMFQAASTTAKIKIMVDSCFS